MPSARRTSSGMVTWPFCVTLMRVILASNTAADRPWLAALETMSQAWCTCTKSRSGRRGSRPLSPTRCDRRWPHTTPNRIRARLSSCLRSAIPVGMRGHRASPKGHDPEVLPYWPKRGRSLHLGDLVKLRNGKCRHHQGPLSDGRRSVVGIPPSPSIPPSLKARRGHTYQLTRGRSTVRARSMRGLRHCIACLCELTPSGGSEYAWPAASAAPRRARTRRTQRRRISAHPTRAGRERHRG